MAPRPFAVLLVLAAVTTVIPISLEAASGAVEVAAGGCVAGAPAPTRMNLDNQLVPTFTARLNGGVVAAGCGLRGKGAPSAAGSIDLVGIPPGAGIVKAILNWAVLDTAPMAATVIFHEASQPTGSVTGTLLGSDDSPCWSGTGSVWVWSADVTTLVAASGNASYTIELPDSGVLASPPSAEGATLIVVYCSAASAQTHVVIYEGVQTVNNGKSTQTVTGFTSSSLRSGAMATFVIADGQGRSYPTWGGRAKIAGVDVIGPPMDGDEGLRCGAQLGEFYDVDTVDVSALVAAGQTSVTAEIESYPAPVQGDCLTWSALVLEVAADFVDPPPLACSAACPVTPEVDAGPDRSVCLGDSVALSATVTPSCLVGIPQWQWLEGALPVCPWGPLPDCLVTPTATSIYTVEYRCTGEPCTGNDSLLVIVDPDVPPGDLGNTLRAVRQGLSVAMSWGADPLARTYNLWRGVVKGLWPAPPLLAALPTTTIAVPDVPGPPTLYLYRVAGVSCSGREGL